jgi:hypothetical protein
LQLACPGGTNVLPPISHGSPIPGRCEVPGLARTARGPSMSADPGKVEIQGVTEIHGEKVFVLRFIQGRDGDWVQRPFFAKYSEEATWLNHLEPALGASEFFYEAEFAAMKEHKQELIMKAS